jgi:hypothetical protein
MSKADEYRRNANECCRMAQSTRDPDDRAAWLRLADSWRRMLGPLDDGNLKDISPGATRRDDAPRTQH